MFRYQPFILKLSAITFGLIFASSASFSLRAASLPLTSVPCPENNLTALCLAECVTAEQYVELRKHATAGDDYQRVHLGDNFDNFKRNILHKAAILNCTSYQRYAFDVATSTFDERRIEAYKRELEHELGFSFLTQKISHEGYVISLESKHQGLSPTEGKATLVAATNIEPKCLTTLIGIIEWADFKHTVDLELVVAPEDSAQEVTLQIEVDGKRSRLLVLPPQQPVGSN